MQKVRELISVGANLNTFDDLGNTALHIAVELNFVNIVDILLTAGADPSIENDLGQTPFQLAHETFLRYQQILKLFSPNS
ncbi:MAG: ankyrin repeat domain-containing protein [Acidobacteria bacterium]|nr:ankyrin repeat domain-containing protein [Acidobacteriota bacterium]